MSPQQGADNPKGEEPRGPRPAEEEAEPSEASSAEWVEEGVPEEPCYYGHGLAWNNRHWRGWKPRETPRMPPKESVSVDMQQVKPPSDRTQPTGQLQPPSRDIDHEEFCKILNEMPLPYDDAERANFDQQDVFILGDPAASFDRSGSHSYDRKTSDPHASYSPRLWWRESPHQICPPDTATARLEYRWLLRWWELIRDHHCGLPMIYGSPRAHRLILHCDHTP